MADFDALAGGIGSFVQNFFQARRQTQLMGLEQEKAKQAERRTAAAEQQAAFGQNLATERFGLEKKKFGLLEDKAKREAASPQSVFGKLNVNTLEGRRVLGAAKAIMDDPTATPEQKKNAQDLLAGTKIATSIQQQRVDASQKQAEFKKKETLEGKQTKELDVITKEFKRTIGSPNMVNLNNLAGGYNTILQQMRDTGKVDKPRTVQFIKQMITAIESRISDQDFRLASGEGETLSGLTKKVTNFFDGKDETTLTDEQIVNQLNLARDIYNRTADANKEIFLTILKSRDKQGLLDDRTRNTVQSTFGKRMPRKLKSFKFKRKKKEAK